MDSLFPVNWVCWKWYWNYLASTLVLRHLKCTLFYYCKPALKYRLTSFFAFAKKNFKMSWTKWILTLLRKLCCPVHKENVHQSTSVSDLWSVLAGAFRVVSREKHNAVQKQRHLWLCKKQWAIEPLNQKLIYSKMLLVLCKICHYYICSLLHSFVNFSNKENWMFAACYVYSEKSSKSD